MGVRQQEKVIVNGGTAKKRWVAPEVTRLEFPKTAGIANHHPGHDSAVTYVFLS